MANNRNVKDKEMAAMLKRLGVKRTTGACPWGCGRQITNGGQGLLIHLNTCRGKASKVSRRVSK